MSGEDVKKTLNKWIDWKTDYKVTVSENKFIIEKR
jgi:hypothetical protein